MMLWSVVIPVNTFREALLKRCLDSVISQSQPDMEILVVDSSSKGEALDLVDGYVGVQYSQIVDRGMAANWNQAIRVSKGDWVHLLHDDDYNKPGFYAGLAPIVGLPVGAACVAYENENEQGQVTFRNAASVETGIIKDFLGTITQGNCLVPSAVVIHRSTYQTCGYYIENECIAADWEFYVRTAVRGVKWWNTPMILSRRQDHKENASTQQGRASVYSAIHRSIEVMEKYVTGLHLECLRRARRTYGSDAIHEAVYTAGDEGVEIFLQAQKLLRGIS